MPPRQAGGQPLHLIFAAKETERHVIETALRLGVAPRVEIDTPGQARPYLGMGVRHFCMGWDVGTCSTGSNRTARSCAP